MAIYNGFCTLQVDMPRSIINNGIDGGPGTTNTSPYIGKKFRLTDEQLVIRDFINSLNIKQGEKVGQPNYGTIMWSFLFEQQSAQLNESIRQEIYRMANLDPRISLNDVVVYAHENGILVEIQMSVAPFQNIVQLAVFIDPSSGNAQQMLLAA